MGSEPAAKRPCLQSDKPDTRTEASVSILSASSLTSDAPMLFDLSQPLGVFFDDTLVAKGVKEDSQAARLGICKGWRVRSVAGEPLSTTKELVTRIQTLKAEGMANVAIAFEIPELSVTFQEAAEHAARNAGEGGLAPSEPA